MIHVPMKQTDESYIYLFHQFRQKPFHAEDCERFQVTRDALVSWESELQSGKNHLVSYGYSQNLKLIHYLYDILGGRVELNIGKAEGNLYELLHSLRLQLDIFPFEFILMSANEFNHFMVNEDMFEPLPGQQSIRYEVL
ncbi:MAG: hypothetical protein AAF518_00330 [Spirochaetota bacterium]